MVAEPAVALNVPLGHASVGFEYSVGEEIAALGLVFGTERAEFVEVALVVGAVVRVPGHFHGDVVGTGLVTVLNNRKPVGQNPIVTESPLAQQARVTAKLGDDAELGHIGLEPRLPVVHRQWRLSARLEESGGVFHQIQLVQAVVDRHSSRRVLVDTVGNAAVAGISHLLALLVHRGELAQQRPRQEDASASERYQAECCDLWKTLGDTANVHGLCVVVGVEGLHQRRHGEEEGIVVDNTGPPSLGPLVLLQERDERKVSMQVIVVRLGDVEVDSQRLGLGFDLTDAGMRADLLRFDQGENARASVSRPVGKLVERVVQSPHRRGDTKINVGGVDGLGRLVDLDGHGGWNRAAVLRFPQLVLSRRPEIPLEERFVDQLRDGQRIRRDVHHDFPAGVGRQFFNFEATQHVDVRVAFDVIGDRNIGVRVERGLGVAGGGPEQGGECDDGQQNDDEAQHLLPCP